MVEHANGDVVDPSLMTLDQAFQRIAITRACALHERSILQVHGRVVCDRISGSHNPPPDIDLFMDEAEEKNGRSPSLCKLRHAESQSVTETLDRIAWARLD